MRIEAIRSLKGLMAIRDEWEQLWHSQPYPNPYNSWVWQRGWIEANHLEQRLFILLARSDAGELIGIAPLQRIPLAFPIFYALSFIGQESSISPDFLIKTGHEQEVCENILQYAVAIWNIAGMVLSIAEPVSGISCALDGKIKDRYGFVSIEQISERPILQLPTTYDDFLIALSSKMRQETRSARKKLEEGHALVFSFGDEEKDFETRLDELLSLNALRWEKSGSREIYKSVYKNLHKAGMLKIFLLYVDGQPAAALSALVSREAMYAEIAGFNYEVDSRHLGKCFYGMVIEWAIQNGYRIFDFSSGSEEYKLRYNPQVFLKHRVIISRSPCMKFLLETSRLLGRRIRWAREPAIT